MTTSVTGELPGLRERKRAETRAAIETAAVELVHEHGFDSVSVESICDRAGVSQRTFFNYFPAKEAAVLGPMLFDMEGIDYSNVADGQGDVMSDLMEFVVRLRSGFDRDRALAVKRKDIIRANVGLQQGMFRRMHLIEAGLQAAVAARVAARMGMSPDAPEVLEHSIMHVQLAVALMRFATNAILSGSSEEDFRSLLERGRVIAAEIARPV